MEQITIVGLGFIGTSIGYTLRLNKRRDFKVVGFDIETKVQQKAQKNGAVDKAAWGLPTAIEDADLVILAVPSLAVRDLFEEIAPHLMNGATVMDTTTTKREVTKWADELLPRSVGFVGTHPLVTGTGVEEARADLFEGARWAISTTTYAPQESVRTVVRFIEKLDAKPFFIGIEEHDSFIGATSHMPIILSNAMMLAAARSPSWGEISRFAAGDFSELSKLAKVNPEVSLGAVAGNQDMVIHWIDQVMQELAGFRTMLADESCADPEGPLMATFNDAWEARLRWDAGISPNEIERPRLPSAADNMMTLFVGERVSRRFKEMTAREDDRDRGRGGA